jgi:tetratricopeptide (TPR) repeat protein
MPSSVSAPLLVERALALVPDYEDFLPLSDALVGASRVDGGKRWASSGAYLTVGKRVVDPDRASELLPALLERRHRRMAELMERVLEAVREQQRGNAAGAAELLVRAGEVEEGDRRLDRAERIYRMALSLAGELREKGPEVLALRRLGRTARGAGRLDEAWSWYRRSHELAVEARDAEGEVIACQGLGNVCDDRGERDLAREWWERGLARAAGLEAPHLEWPLLLNLSVLTMLEGDLEEAERLLLEAGLRIGGEDTGEGRFFRLNNRGLLLLEHGDAPAAEAVFREGLEGAEGHWALTLRVNLGEALLRQGRLLEAEDEARRAEELAVVQRMVPDLVDVYALLGAIARERRDGEGFVFYEEALRVCHERALPRKREAALLHGYGLLHLSCGRADEGRGYLEAARDVYRLLGFAPELGRVEEALKGLAPAEPAAAV